MTAQYSSLKPSKNKFNGQIPSHWNDVPIRSVCKIKSVQNNIGEELLSVFLDRGVVRYSDTSGKQVHKPSDDMSKYQLVEPRDIVLNNQQAWRGSVGVSQYRGIVSPAYIVMSLDESINDRFVNYMIRNQACVAQFVLASKGVGSIQRILSPTKLKSSFFTLPPREEQDQIVKYLDWQTSQINTLINAKKKEITLLEEKRKSFVFELTTKGIALKPDLRESDIYWLTKIPTSWGSIALSRIFVQVKNKNVGMQEKNLLSLSYGRIIRRDINATEGLLPDNFEGYNIIKPNDIVLRLTDLQNDQKSLRTGIATERGTVTSAYLTIRNQSDNESEYLQFILHSFDLIKGFYNYGASGVRQGLNWDALKTLRIPIPPISEQRAIIGAIKKEYFLTDTAIASIRKEIEVLAEYRSKIISDVVTGQIDVRNVEIPSYHKVEEVSDDESTANCELDLSEVD